MPTHRFIERLQSIDYYIRTKSTGTPKEFAEKLRVSERQLYKYLKNLKELGAPIKYNKNSRSYYYDCKGFFAVKFIYE
jgi:predicted DNA-binding transcriptional regulator YafY